jgi:hypothetical protein
MRVLILLHYGNHHAVLISGYIQGSMQPINCTAPTRMATPLLFTFSSKRGDTMAAASVFFRASISL